ncbi:MAG TPA: LysR substrate-binding domain-containing protein [Magnetospirillaceae bacterium]
MKRALDRRLKIRHLRVIETIAAQGSVVRAAKVLGLTQPAVTQALRETELMMGVPLFQRHNKGVTPTAVGERVIETARSVVFELHRLEQELDQTIDHGAGTISIGALPAAAAGLLPGVLARMRDTHPEIAVGVVQGRTEEMLAALQLGEVDMVVGRLYEAAKTDRFHRAVLYEEPIVIVARTGHPLFRKGKLTAAMLGKYPLALPTATQRVHRDIERFIQSLDLSQDNALRSSSLPLIREMLLSTDTIAIMPRLMMAGDLLRKAVREVIGLAPPLMRHGGLILRPDRKLSRSAQLFVDTLRAYLGAFEPKT